MSKLCPEDINYDMTFPLVPIDRSFEDVCTNMPTIKTMRRNGPDSGVLYAQI
jgi:hypothetical protein